MEQWEAITQALYWMDEKPCHICAKKTHISKLEKVRMAESPKDYCLVDVCKDCVMWLQDRGWNV